MILSDVEADGVASPEGIRDNEEPGVLGLPMVDEEDEDGE